MEMDQGVVAALVGFAGLMVTGGVAYAAKVNKDAVDLAIREHAANCAVRKNIEQINDNILKIWEFLAGRQGGQP